VDLTTTTDPNDEMLFIATIILTTVLGLGLGAVALTKRPEPVAVPVAPVDPEAARRAAILERVRRVGVAPDDLRLLQRH
jgi:uncharacterized membrane protein (UPF0182 family)